MPQAGRLLKARHFIRSHPYVDATEGVDGVVVQERWFKTDAGFSALCQVHQVILLRCRSMLPLPDERTNYSNLAYPRRKDQRGIPRFFLLVVLQQILACFLGHLSSKMISSYVYCHN